MKGLSFKSVLHEICASRGVTISGLSSRLGVSSSYLHHMGTLKGLPRQRLEDIFTILKTTPEEQIKLKCTVLFAIPKKIKIDQCFIDSVGTYLKKNKSDLEDKQAVYEAVLHFVGIKTG